MVPSALAPPFTIRARIITPLAAGGTLDLADGSVTVDEAGRITSAAAATDSPPDVVAAAMDQEQGRGVAVAPVDVAQAQTLREIAVRCGAGHRG